MCYVATLGGFLRDELPRRGWSPEEFSRRCTPSVSTTLIYQIMNGKDNVKRTTFGAIAGALGMTPVELMVAIDGGAGGPPGLSPKLALLNALLRHASDEEIEQVHDFARWKVQPTQKRAIGRQDESAKRREAAIRKLNGRRATGDDDGLSGPLINRSQHPGLFGTSHRPESGDGYHRAVTAN